MSEVVLEGAKTLPLALIQGEPMLCMPEDLYIPPEALRVLLETFHGPLDLLLYLIKKNNIDILDIPIAQITNQYMEYIDLMKTLQLELVADYLVMAATLAEIKSRFLLPRPINSEGYEEDPRAELVRRLQAYEQFKLASQQLDELPRLERDLFMANANVTPIEEVRLPQLSLYDLLSTLQQVLQRAQLNSKHLISREPLSVRERMSTILSRLTETSEMQFIHLFKVEEGRMGVTVTFIAILELLKQSLIEIFQDEIFSPILIKARSYE